ncbi:MAG: helicase [Nitrospirae bacterium]|nr:MAG: helicase [Nitrospirota bacterium]
MQLDLFQESGTARATTGCVVAFDLETQRSFDEVGGRGALDRLGVSVAVVGNLDRGTYTSYREAEMGELVEDLFAAKLVVGFNTLGFDYAVLAAYTDRDLRRLPSLDILVEIQRELGYRVSLDKVAAATLGTRKSGHGLEAIEWYRRGEWEKLIRYCTDDVRITADLYRYGRDHGHLYYLNRWGEKARVNVSW